MYKCNACENTETFKRWAIYSTSGTERRLEGLDNEGNTTETLDYGENSTHDSNFDEYDGDLECGECSSTDIDENYDGEETKKTPKPMKMDTDGNYW